MSDPEFAITSPQRRPNLSRAVPAIGGSRSPRASRGPWRWGFPIVALAICGGLLLAPIGSARADVAGLPSLSSAYILGHGAALLLVGYLGFFGVWTTVANGSQVYTDALYLVLFNLQTVNETVSLAAVQGNNTVASVTSVLPPLSQVGVALNLPLIHTWTRTVLVADGVRTWVGQIAVPISLLPPYILNIGGLDLLALGIVAGCVYAFVGAFAIARWLMKRAIYAPRFSLALYGHVALILLAGAVFADYRFIDSAFAGWSPLIYPIAIFPFVFVTALSYFNRAAKVELLQGIATESGEMAWRRTLVRVGLLPDGRAAFIGGSWWDFWARVWGHFPIFDDGDETKTAPLLQPVENAPSPTDPPKKGRRKRTPRAYPIGPHRLLAFRVANPQEDEVGFLGWVKQSEPVRFRYPRLRWTRAHTLPAEYLPAGPAGGAPIQTKLERIVRKLSLPHYEQPTVSPSVELEDKHYVFGAAVWAGFASIRDLARAVSKLGQEVAFYRARLHNEVQDELYSKLRTHYALTGRATSGISETEAAQLTGGLGRLIESDRKKPRSEEGE